jgi:hypothetical protein
MEEDPRECAEHDICAEHECYNRPAKGYCFCENHLYGFPEKASQKAIKWKKDHELSTRIKEINNEKIRLVKGFKTHRDFQEFVMLELRVNYHPDTNFNEYVDIKNNKKKSFTLEEARILNEARDKLLPEEENDALSSLKDHLRFSVMSDEEMTKEVQRLGKW